MTGRPCKNGHIAERYTTTGTCVACQGVYRAEERARIEAARARAKAAKQGSETA